MLYFECNSADCYETLRYPTFPNGDPESGENLGGRDLIKYALSAPQDPDPTETWFRLIVAYTSCNLTKESDKLPALSGLASRLHELTGDHYIAGMWRSKLLRQLCWMRAITSSEKKSLHPVEIPPSSWSWISCDYALNFPNDVFMHPERLFCRVDFEDIHAKPLGLDPYVEVILGKLTVSGRVREVLVCCSPGNYVRERCPHCLCASSNDRRPISEYSPDTPLPPPTSTSLHSGEKLACLLLGIRHPGLFTDGGDSWFGLVLQPVIDHPNTFRRVGFTSTLHSLQAGNWMTASQSPAFILEGDWRTVNLV